MECFSMKQPFEKRGVSTKHICTLCGKTHSESNKDKSILSDSS